MNIRQGAPQDDWALAKFGVGQPVLRTEDPTLVQGRGRYVDDLALPGQVYAVMVRSPHAHGILRGVDAREAAAMPGVLGVYKAADLKGYGPLKCVVPFKNRDGSEMKKPARFALADGKVRFVGDPVACVVAQTRAQARDAAEAVALDIEPLPAVTLASEAALPGAPQLYDDVPGNVSLDYHYGDSEQVAAAFARAAYVTRLPLRNTRLVVAAMEPRAAIAQYDAQDERFTLHTQSQGLFGMRALLAGILNVEPGKVHLLTGHIGGSFGMKSAIFGEYICILHAARQLGRPVKWTDERSGSFVSDSHGRDHEVTAELALDVAGHFLALRVEAYANMGGYLSAVAPLPGTINIVKNIVGVYRTPLVEVSSKCVFTNTTQVSAYRGAGRPEGNYFMERLIDRAAAETGIDRATLRARNQIAPSQLPFAAASGMNYDSGDFPGLFARALKIADIDGFPARRRDSEANGKLRGLGFGSFLEVTAAASKEMGGICFEPDGYVTIVTGTLDQGQGHAAPFAQVLSGALGIPFERIRLQQRDSDELLAGGGTGGSRSIAASGAAILQASEQVIEKGKAIASHVLEAAVDDIEFKQGRFAIAGTDRSIGILELAETLRSGIRLPEDAPRTLDVDHVSDGVPSVFPNGCHVCEVEIDPETGQVEVVSYASVNDFGNVINPLLVEGQVHGGVVQGIGQALLENVVYDAEGQLLTGSFQDYAMPRARHAPPIGFVSHPVPTTSNPLGVKGCGEAGCAGALVCATNAIVDALSVYGIRHLDMPASPSRVWAAIEAAKRDKAA